MPKLDMCTLAPEASVALMASATSDSTSAASYTACGSAESGGFSSAVTANRPARRTRSRRPPARRGRSGDGTLGLSGDGLLRESQHTHEDVVEIGAAGQLEIFDEIRQPVGGFALAERQQADLGPLAGGVA